MNKKTFEAIFKGSFHIHSLPISVNLFYTYYTRMRSYTVVKYSFLGL
ncbi:MAG: hypothetical protein ACI9C9_002941, partial [Marivirga sp.]